MSLLLTNLLIVGVILAVVFVTHNPLAILGLVLLQHMPVMPAGYFEQDDDDDEPKIGFTAEVE